LRWLFETAFGGAVGEVSFWRWAAALVEPPSNALIEDRDNPLLFLLLKRDLGKR